MKKTTEARDTGVEWLNGEVTEDINYTDNLALPSKSFEDAQERIIRLSRKAKAVRLKVNEKEDMYVFKIELPG